MNRTVKTLLIQGVKAVGSYDPDEVLPLIEEGLTGEEAKFAEGFLKWCDENGTGFGPANFSARAAEYKRSEQK